MARIKRSKRGPVPKPYKSWLEVDVAEVLGKRWKYEEVKFEYIVPESKHWYTPDFSKGELFIETKGRLDSADRKKLLLWKKQYPEVQLILAFANPNSPINKGSRTTVAQWAEKNEFEWLDALELINNKGKYFE